MSLYQISPRWTRIVGVCDKKIKGPLHNLDVQGPWVPGQLRMSNPDWWGPGGEFIEETHIVRVCDKKDKGPLYTLGVQGPWVLGQVKMSILIAGVQGSA